MLALSLVLVELIAAAAAPPPLPRALLAESNGDNIGVHTDEAINSNITQPPPNVVIVVVDDWGWHNWGWHVDGQGHEEVVTPNLDALVAEGVELGRHYVHPTCTPSRAALQTGRLPVHVVDKLVGPCDRVGAIPSEMTTLAAMMKRANYSSHHVGKWDVGMTSPRHTPVGRGHDDCLSYFGHGNWAWSQTEWGGSQHNRSEFPPPDIVDLWDSNRPARGLNGTAHEEELFMRRIRDVIFDHTSDAKGGPKKPLFLQYHSKLNHYPLQAPLKYQHRFAGIDDDNRKMYSAMTAFLDDQVGELTRLLKQSGLWDDTLMIVTSDNGGYVLAPEGPCNTTFSRSTGEASSGASGSDIGHGTACWNGEAGANNYPLRGGKYSWFEGGIRVNAFVSGGAIPRESRGTRSDSIIHVADWYGTLCRLAGLDDCGVDASAAAAGLPKIDSVDQRAAIAPGLANRGARGSGDLPTGREGFPASADVIIQGKFKFVRGGTRLVGAGWAGQRYPNSSTTAGHAVGDSSMVCPPDIGCLFDVVADREERVNLALDTPGGRPNPDAVRLLRELDDAKTTFWGSPDHGNDPACEKAAHDLYGGFYGPWQNL